MTHSKVSHNGTVIRLEGEAVFVKIEVKSSCSACHAKGICSASEMSEKIVETIPLDSVAVGDEVIVEMDERLGLKAVLFAFFIPFVLLASVLFTTYSITDSEPLSALLAVGILVPYYLLVVVFKKYFKKSFVFTCRKISNISQ